LLQQKLQKTDYGLITFMRPFGYKFSHLDGAIEEIDLYILIDFNRYVRTSLVPNRAAASTLDKHYYVKKNIQG
jgi:hypothetical protein